MSVTCFIADTLLEALAQMRAQFGAEGVVLNVRYVNPSSFANLWERTPVELVACQSREHARTLQRVHVEESVPVASAAVSGLLSRIGELHEQLDSWAAVPNAEEVDSSRGSPITPEAFKSLLADSLTHSEELVPKTEIDGHRNTEEMRRGGSSPQFESVSAALQKVGVGEIAISQVCSVIDGASFASADGASQRSQLRQALAGFWKPSDCGQTLAGKHLFVGAPGCGKSTILSKWLAQAALLGGCSSYVWRLDGRGPNTAEALSIYSEVLGVPVARAWNGESQPVNLEFFDLPGTDWWDSSAMSELADRIEQIKPTEVHLVLNAAYDASGLLGQLERFSKLPLTDIIFSHLDEPVQAGRLWNIVLASELPIRFLSAGQNVPGHFRQASHDQLLPEEFQQ